MTNKRRNHPAALIGVGFGTAWMIIGVFGLPVSFRTAGVLCILLLACAVSAGVWQAPRAHNERSDRRRALIAWSIGSEFAAMGAAITACIVTSHTALIWPVIALIVGLHFLPLARAFNEIILVATGVLMSLLAVASLVLPEPIRMVVLGFGAGLVLWGTILYDAASKSNRRNV